MLKKEGDIVSALMKMYKSGKEDPDLFRTISNSVYQREMQEIYNSLPHDQQSRSELHGIINLLMKDDSFYYYKFPSFKLLGSNDKTLENLDLINSLPLNEAHSRVFRHFTTPSIDVLKEISNINISFAQAAVFKSLDQRNIVTLNKLSHININWPHVNVFEELESKNLDTLQILNDKYSNLSAWHSAAFQLLQTQHRTLEILDKIYQFDGLTVTKCSALRILSTVTLNDIERISGIKDLTKIHLKAFEIIGKGSAKNIDIIEKISELPITEAMVNIIRQLHAPSLEILQKIESERLTFSCTAGDITYSFALNEGQKNCLETEQDISGCLQLPDCDNLQYI